MSSMFGRLLRSSPAHENKKTEQINNVEIVTGDQPHNPYTELGILNLHTDIVRHLLAIDHYRLVSGGDDGILVIWNLQARQKQFVLSEHKRPITCLCLQENNSSTNETVLLSAASDHLICIWDVGSGLLLRKLSEHCGTAKCLLSLQIEGTFISGGDQLCLWNIEGKLQQTLTRGHSQEEVYNMDEFDGKIKLIKKLAPHREAVRCLTKLNASSLASGSLDGTIIVWSVDTLVPLRCFNSVVEFEGDDKLYPYSAQCVLSLDQKYVVSSVGAGFCVYDTRTGRLVAERSHAHFSRILHMALIYDSLLLATCSEDGTVRLWGSSKSFSSLGDPSYTPAPLEDLSNPADTALHTTVTSLHRWLGVTPEDLMLAGEAVKPELLGECLGHTGSVQMCVDCGVQGLVTCGSDGMVLVWQDGVIQGLRMNTILRELQRGRCS